MAPGYGSLTQSSTGSRQSPGTAPGGEDNLEGGLGGGVREQDGESRPSYSSRLPVFVGAVFSVLAVVMMASARKSAVGSALYSTYASLVTVTYANSNAFGANAIVGEYDSVGTDVDLMDPMDSSSINWSFSRDGYAAVNLHNDFFVYDILGDYDAVLEPYVPMSLLVTNGDSSSYYKYSVCFVESEKTDRSCQYGTLSTDPKSIVASSGITMECDPYDELEVEITQYSSTDNSASQTVSGSALCM